MSNYIGANSHISQTLTYLSNSKV